MCSFISTSELLQRSHYTHPEAVSLNSSVGVERIETIQERLFEAQFAVWLGSREMGRKPLQRRALKKINQAVLKNLIGHEYDMH